MAVIVDDEAGALALLGHRTEEEVVGDGARGDVHHRRDDAVVDLDIVLLFRIELLGTRSFAKFDVRRARDDFGGRVGALMMSGEPVKGSGEEHTEEKRSRKFHGRMCQDSRSSRVDGQEIDVPYLKV